MGFEKFLYIVMIYDITSSQIMSTIQIFIETHFGNTITLSVNTTDTIASVKQNALLQNMPLLRFGGLYGSNLSFNGMELNDEQTLEQCNVVDQTTLSFGSSLYC